MSILKLINPLAAAKDSDDPKFHQLGKCLLFLNDYDAASIAFEQAISAPSGDGTIQHLTLCNTYGLRGGISGMRYVCSICADTDLCETCMKKYSNDLEIRGCVQHEFLRVPRDLWKAPVFHTVNDEGDSSHNWLKVVERKHKGQVLAEYVYITRSTT